ncbi:MAG TPA: DUF4437 domain-containing protein [Thermoanaerobaculia bacterium]|jgi:anti-sigma factor ChrR (cupin superfamily)
MRARGILVLVASFVLAGAVLAQSKMSSMSHAAKAPIFMPASDMKWTDLDPQGAPGVKIVDLWGDHTKGAFGALTKFPAGFSAPLHTHTNACKIVVISGTFIQAPEGKPEVRLGAGSYEMQPGDGYKHTTACDKASECVFFIEGSGKFDLKPVEAAKK